MISYDYYHIINYSLCGLVLNLNKPKSLLVEGYFILFKQTIFGVWSIEILNCLNKYV